MSVDTAENKPRGTIGVKILIVFLFLFGALIFYAVIPSIFAALQQRAWTKLSCTIESSKLVSDERGSALAVEYTYTRKGKTERSNNYAVKTSAVISDEELLADSERLKPGTIAPCWISDDTPPISVLRRERLDTLIVLIFPLLLIPGSLIAAKVMWFPSKKKEVSRLQHEPNKNTSSKSFSFGIFAFFGVFVAVGLGLTYLFFGRHYLAAQRMQSWREASCTIEYSDASSHTSRDKDGKTSTSYSFEVRYAYEDQGKRYVGTEYNPAQGSYSSYSVVSDLENKYSKGVVVTCYVNPDDILESALARDMPSETWYGLFPMIFAFAGLFGWVYVLGDRFSRSNDRTVQGRVSKKASSRFGGLIKLIATAVLWNGIVAAVLFGFWQSWMNDKGSIFPLLIIVPFALIGLLILISIPYAALQIFNPTLDIDLQGTNPEPDTSFSVGYRLNGSPRRIRSLEIILELWLLPSPQRVTKGTTASDKDRVSWKPLLSLPIVSTDREQAFLKGTGSVRIPPLSALPQRSGRERLQWKLRWALKIPWFPDSQEIIELGILRSDDAVDEDLQDDEDE